MRLPREQYLMQMAVLTASRGTCPRAQVGAVLVRESRIVSTGYNGAPSGFSHCDHVGCFWKFCLTCGKDRPAPECPGCRYKGCERSIHAEENAIVFAARNGLKTAGSELFVTHSPCTRCAMLIINAGITAVYYKELARDTYGLTLLRGSTGIGIQQICPPAQPQTP